MTENKDAQLSGGVEHDHATCPECAMLNVNIYSAPRKPVKMVCSNCGWDSISGEPIDDEMEMEVSIYGE